MSLLHTMQSATSGFGAVSNFLSSSGLTSSCFPTSLKTLDLFDNQLDELGSHLTVLPMLVRVDIGANNMSSEEVKSLGPRLSYFKCCLFMHIICAGIQSYRKICEIGVVKFLWEEPNVWWEEVEGKREESGRRNLVLAPGGGRGRSKLR